MSSWIAVILVSLAWGAAPPADTQPSASGEPVTAAGQTVSSERFDRLVADLRHPRFAVRQAATEALSNLDASYLPALADRYRAETDYETKRRIRYVVEFIFHRRQIADRAGFLGVEISRITLADVADPVTGQPMRAVIISEVKEGFPAQRCGMQDGDIIIGFDGQPVPNDPTAASFIKLVSSRPPGSRATVRVLRPAARARELTVEVPDHSASVLEGVTMEPMPLIQKFPHKGLRVIRVKPGSPAEKLGLRPNEIMVSVAGRSLGDVGAPQTLAAALQAVQPGEKFTVGVRAMSDVTLPLVLGARPPEFIENKDDLAEARLRFARWWQEQGGELTMGHEAEPSWLELVQRPVPRTPVAEPAILP